MERFHLWSLFVQLAFALYPEDFRVDFINEILRDAADDPDLEIEFYAKLLCFSDQLVRR